MGKMLSLQKFEKIIANLASMRDSDHALHKHGLEMGGYTTNLYQIIDLLFEEYIGQDGADWIYWYVYEKGLCKDLKATDADGKEICYNVESLYKTVFFTT